ncbi:SMP-30/gluconolactonase/LRE family protein [Paraburkholderia sediminicola]|jgi:sugar lactone lactonase YvrE/DNA-binding IclR family transcriptional regulator|uniref:SMP-30/gluconolactonase/LRE family protein n=2 Tax=Paraburkholderia sediminicola TaxID=458836 RepID=UPI0038B871BF
MLNDMPASEVSGSAGLGVLDKALALLNIVSAKRAPMSFTDLQRASALPKSTLHRLTQTLVHEGLLRYDAYTKKFQLGLRLLEMAHKVWSDFDLRVAAQDTLAALRDSLGETVQLAVLNGDEVVIVASADAAHDMARTSSVGMPLPVHATAAGKAIVANLDPAQSAKLIERLEMRRFTDRTLLTTAALRDDLDLARARGYALEEGEWSAQSVSVAAPIFDYEGRPIGAVTVTGDVSRLKAERLHGLSPVLIGAARGISHSAAGAAMSIAPREQPKQTSTVEVRCVTRAQALLGEGPIWSPRDNALYWVDILTPSVHTYHAADGSSSEVRLGSMSSVAIPKATGGLLLATPGGLMNFDPATRRMAPLCHPEAERPANRFNDGKCDRRGRLWIASMDMATALNRGSLFRVQADGSWRKMDTGFTVPNGLGWSPDDSRMYFVDTHRRALYEYDFDLMSGSIANRRTLIEFAPTEGRADGLTVDDEGCIWIAMWDAWHVVRYAPDGREIQRIRMPVPRPTSCCFGGPNLDTLYVTSASVRLGEQALAEAPLSGSLFAMEIPGVRGLPEATFAG